MNWRLESSPYRTWPPSCPQPGATQTDQEAWPAGAPLLAAQSELHVQKQNRNIHLLVILLIS